MNIGFFTDAYIPLPNGVSTSVERCVRALENRGHEVSIIAPNVPNYKDKRKNVYRLPSVRFVTADSRFALHIPNRVLLKIVKKDFDIIHAHNGGPISFLGWEIAKTRGIPYVFTYWTLIDRYTHYFWNGKLATPAVMRFVSRVICNYSDYLIVSTNRVKRELISYGVNQQIHILPTGIELEEYNKIKKGFIRNKIKIGKDTRILLHVGRLGKEKSVDFLIKAFAEINKTLPNTVLVLVGSGTEEKALQELVIKLQLENRVHFLGSFNPDSIPQVYADADIFLFASQTETQGMVIIEALASGLPIVAVKDEAFKNVVENNKNGYLVEKNSLKFAQKTIKLLSDNKLHNSFSVNARQTALQFSVKKTAQYLDDVYETLIKENKSKFSKRRVIIKNLDDFRNLLTRVKVQLKSL